MTTLWQRFVYIDRTHKYKVNILAYPFVFATLVYGLGFALLGSWSGVSTSSLFHSLMAVSPALPVVWGVAAVVAAGLSIAMILARRRGFGEVASMMGFCVWFFAALTYLLNGFWLVLFTVAVPNLYFWVCFYLLAKGYQRHP